MKATSIMLFIIAVEIALLVGLKVEEQYGVEFIKKPDDGSMKGLAFIKDPDGYWIEILNAEATAGLAK